MRHSKSSSFAALMARVACRNGFVEDEVAVRITQPRPSVRRLSATNMQLAGVVTYPFTRCGMAPGGVPTQWKPRRRQPTADSRQQIADTVSPRAEGRVMKPSYPKKWAHLFTFIPP
jgi:hypothetical protein